MTDPQPIAVLDTGAGGLSVVAALRLLAPGEHIHYFADTAHVPYGLKSPELIRNLSMRAAKTLVLLSRPKILVIACHTISAWCLKELRQEFRIPVVATLEPSIKGLNALINTENYRSLGIISTAATLSSKAFSNAWPHIDPKGQTKLIEQACGPLVSLVEESSLMPHDLRIILDGFLSASIKQADALLLGCTHFSALTPALRALLRPEAKIIDAADFIAHEVIDQLKEKNNLSAHALGSIQSYVSDNPERFLTIAKKFTNDAMKIELIRLKDSARALS